MVRACSYTRVVLSDDLPRLVRHLRVWAVVLGVVTFGLRAACEAWLLARTPLAPEEVSELSPPPNLARLAPMLLFVLFMLVDWRLRGGTLPRDLLRARSGSAVGFIVPSAPWLLGSTAILLAFLIGGAIWSEWALAGGWTPIGWLLALTTCAFAAGLVWWRHGRYEVALSPQGLRVRKLRWTAILWDQLVPGGPDLPPRAAFSPGRSVSRHVLKQSPGVGEVRLAVLNQAKSDYSWFSVKTGSLAVDPHFLAAAVRHYVDHPEHRPAIGSEAELIRLRAALDAEADLGASAAV
jgi:hypothetical protein